ncbi:hypothetical protein OAB88_04525 [Winogradskyella sp.]|nr:hypothetical protein [Winogradskyella sp.]MDC1505488.1 hypothetical protein [Winogradskyella sp.]
MKKIVFILFTLFVSINIYGQRRRNLNAPPVTSRAPTENDIAKRQREIDERKDEYVANFLKTLEADDFQKEILKQYIDSFYQEKIVIFKGKYSHRDERKKALETLKGLHFVEVKALMSDADIVKLTDFIDGKFDDQVEPEDKKKKKKRRKKKKKDGEKSDEN